MTFMELKKESDKLPRLQAAELFLKNTDLSLKDVAEVLSCNIATVRRAKRSLGMPIASRKPCIKKADIVKKAKSETELYLIGRQALNIAAGRDYD